MACERVATQSAGFPPRRSSTAAYGAHPSALGGCSLLRRRPWLAAPWPPHRAQQHDLGSGGGDWFMDTGATSHMASGSGILSSTPSPTVHRHIIVDNGQSISIDCTGHATIPSSSSPLQLRNVLITPHLVKNLVSVRVLTRDNSISVEFDPWGFSIKDLRTKMVLL